MPLQTDDRRWLAAAAALAERARPLASPNPGVGALIVLGERIVGRGWTQAGGRPHAEAMALKQAGGGARGATLFVTLEPCAHRSERGPACADLVAEAGLARAVLGMRDPDQRTSGTGIARLQAAGITVDCADWEPHRLTLSGHQTWLDQGRPHITLKLALSLDGGIAMASGESQWITGEQARAHAHRERARADAILVGGGTMRTDAPQLNVRLPGLRGRSPKRLVLTRGSAPGGWQKLPSPQDIVACDSIRYLMIEGGAQTAAAFLAADMVDRLLIYRAPIAIGAACAGIGDIGLGSLAEAHGRWLREDIRALGADTLEIYRRRR